LEQIPGLDVDAAPVGEQGAALLVVDEPVLGVLVGDSFHAVGELVEAGVRAQSREEPVVAVVDEALGELEIAGGVVPVVRREHPHEQRRAEATPEPVREVVEVEQRGQLPLVVLGPEQLGHMTCLEAVVEIVGATVRAAVKAHPARCSRPGGLGERPPQRAL